MEGWARCTQHSADDMKAQQTRTRKRHTVAFSAVGGHYGGVPSIPVLLVRWRLRRPGLIAEAAQPTYTLDLVP